MLTTVRTAAVLRFLLSRNYLTISNFSNHQWQLSIWLFITRQGNVCINDAKLCVVSPPVLRFSIRRLLTASRRKTFQKMPFSTRFRLRRNRHLSHRKSENGRRIYAWFCITFVYITLFCNEWSKHNWLRICVYFNMFAQQKHKNVQAIKLRQLISEQSDVYGIYEKSCIDSPPIASTPLCDTYTHISINHMTECLY